MQLEQLDAEGLGSDGRLCATTLARAHARSGDRSGLAAALRHKQLGHMVVVLMLQSLVEGWTNEGCAAAAAVRGWAGPGVCNFADCEAIAAG